MSVYGGIVEWRKRLLTSLENCCALASGDGCGRANLEARKLKPQKKFSGGLVGKSAKICTSKNIPLYDTRIDIT